MFAALQVLLAPLLASVEARVTAATTLMLRRALLLVAATLFGIGALMFLSVGLFFALMPALGPGGAALLLAFIWGLLAGLCVLIARQRPRAAAPPAIVPLAAPPAAAPPPAPVAPVAPASPIDRLRTRIGRAAPVLAIGALLAGIIAGRR